MSSGSVNSGVLTVSGSGTASTQAIGQRCRIASIKVSNDAAVDKTVTFYDGTANTAAKIAEVHVGAVNQNFDFDFHGALAVNGVFVEVTGSGSNSGVSFSLQYF